MFREIAGTGQIEFFEMAGKIQRTDRTNRTHCEPQAPILARYNILRLGIRPRDREFAGDATGGHPVNCIVAQYREPQIAIRPYGNPGRHLLAAIIEYPVLPIGGNPGDAFSDCQGCPDVTVRAVDHRSREAVLRQLEFADIAGDINPADLVGLALGKPQCAIRAGNNPAHMCIFSGKHIVGRSALRRDLYDAITGLIDNPDVAIRPGSNASARNFYRYQPQCIGHARSWQGSPKRQSKHERIS